MIWHRKASMVVGDYVAIYITLPVRALRYLCRIVEVARDEQSMTIELIETFDDQQFGIDVLKKYGVNNIRGAHRMTRALIDELGKTVHFNQ